MKTVRNLIVILGLVLLTCPAHAWTSTGKGKITFLENGWYGEGLSIYMTNGISGCPAPNTEYAVQSTHPSYKEIVALATSAFIASTDVELVVNQGDCGLGNRTIILSIRLTK